MTFPNSAVLLPIIILIVDAEQGNIFMSLKQQKDFWGTLL